MLSDSMHFRYKLVSIRLREETIELPTALTTIAKF